MQNVREFNYKFIEVSHVKIETQLLKLWKLVVQFWAPFWNPLEIRENLTWKSVQILTLDKKKDYYVDYKKIQPEIHRGISRQNRDPITQVMESISAVLGSLLKTIGNT